MLGADTLLNEAIRRGAVIAALGGQTVCPACKESPMDVSCACCGHGYPAKAELDELRAQLLGAEQMLVERHKTLKHQNALFEKLDKAMATPERIAQDTALVGGFVSSLDLTETAEEVVARACARLESK
jgi:hypothetical protein